MTIIELFPREFLGIIVGQSLKGEDVKEALTRIARFRDHPSILKSDNGSEFAGKVMDRWAYEDNIEIDFSRPGKLSDYAGKHAVSRPTEQQSEPDFSDNERY